MKADPTAPSLPNVLAQTAGEAVSFHFPYVILRGENFKDVGLSVSFKPISGRLDQAAGIIFRFADSDNYYVLRANALENNLILFKYVNGQRFEFASASSLVPSGQCHSITAVVVGDSIEGYVDGKLLIRAMDSTYKEGFVGLRTKADSVSFFGDFTIE